MSLSFLDKQAKQRVEEATSGNTPILPARKEGYEGMYLTEISVGQEALLGRGDSKKLIGPAMVFIKKENGTPVGKITRKDFFPNKYIDSSGEVKLTTLDAFTKALSSIKHVYTTFGFDEEEIEDKLNILNQTIKRPTGKSIKEVTIRRFVEASINKEFSVKTDEDIDKGIKNGDFTQEDLLKFSTEIQNKLLENVLEESIYGEEVEFILKYVAPDKQIEATRIFSNMINQVSKDTKDQREKTSLRVKTVLNKASNGNYYAEVAKYPVFMEPDSIPKDESRIRLSQKEEDDFKEYFSAKKKADEEFENSEEEFDNPLEEVDNEDVDQVEDQFDDII